MSKVLSPFLTVYKPQMTSMFSIMERITGLILVLVVFSYIVLLKLKTILLTNYCFYSILYLIIKSSSFLFIINSVIIFVIFSFYYHLVFGARYLYWDKTGGTSDKQTYIKIELEDIYKSSYILIGLTSILTIITWIYFII